LSARTSRHGQCGPSEKSPSRHASFRIPPICRGILPIGQIPRCRKACMGTRAQIKRGRIKTASGVVLHSLLALIQQFMGGERVGAGRCLANSGSDPGRKAAVTKTPLDGRLSGPSHPQRIFGHRTQMAHRPGQCQSKGMARGGGFSRFTNPQITHAHSLAPVACWRIAISARLQQQISRLPWVNLTLLFYYLINSFFV